MSNAGFQLAILGAAESGVGAAILGQKLGMEVWVSDAGIIKPGFEALLKERGIPYESGGHTAEKILQANLLIKSPGIPDKAPMVQQALQNGIEVISEIEFGARHTQSPIVAITGTNGKTTTTLLTHHIFQKAGLDAGLGGNVGNSFARMVAEDPHDIYILEVSSFQLDGCTTFKPKVAILTNITPDHLDRYNYQLENYMAAKMRITQAQDASDHFIFNADDPLTAQAMAGATIRAQTAAFTLEKKLINGAFLNTDAITIQLKNLEPMTVGELALQGRHNKANSMAAAIAARLFSIRKESIRESLAGFDNVEHRLEPVLKVHGIAFINDSKATNVNSTWYALECMTTPVIWIAGGVDKGNDYHELLPLVKGRVKALVCLGTDNAKLKAEFNGIVPTIVEVGSMEEAVKNAYHLGDKGDTVLLSPACASFDLFENYEDRGRQFKNWVRQL
jgi:UDP-N-acetylmuramoylalanine--D-glutamate ligase